MATPTDPTRRHLLMVGAAAALIPGCDTLVLPMPDLLDEISPITPLLNFYVQNVGPVPNVQGQDWALTLGDRGTDLATIDQAYLESRNPVEFEHTLQCIGSSPRWPAQGNALWTGVPLTEVLEDLGIAVDPSIVELKLVGADAYHTSVPISDLEAPLWLVWKMAGAPLFPEHGYPARLIVPGRYGTKNVKWLTRIELVDVPHTGYWEGQGWSQDAIYQLNAFVRSPADLQDIPVMPLRIVGTAYAGSVPITRVEVSTDAGETWQDAVVDYGPGANIWTLWSLDFDPPGPGEYQVHLRVTDESGRVADMGNGSDRLQGYDGAQQIAFRCV